ncbi:pyridoxal-dependent decarboxylase domain-containing protein 1-like [Liolophura sinensis]|uniref:pyridoxal-dependent decarboxylase domain-containing protein 1-like n=1 Tax=Liolophura sinensis TaxID=3198878 RepID=UPI0031583501
MATVDKSANDKSESDTDLKPISAQEKETGKMEHKDVSSKEQSNTATAAVKNQSIETTKKVGQPTVYKHFLDPMFDELQKHADQNNAILDRINQKMEEERNERIKARNQEHIPEPLKGSGQTLEDVENSLQEMIAYENFDETDSDKRVLTRLQRLDDIGKAAIMSHDLAAYISTLDTPHLKRFCSKIIADCELWMTRLFRFGEGSVSYHEDERDGVVRMCKLALHQKYPKYATEGFEALYSRPPVIYISAASKSGLGHYICSQLGLPLSCLCTVPCNTMFGATQKMDVAVLEKLIQDDIAAAKTPVLLVAYAGTPQLGHVDNFERLQAICKKNNLWLHVEGDHLATLMMFSVPTSVSPAKSGDSMTVRLGSWLGIPGLPNATLYKKCDPALSHAIGLNTFNPQLKLNSLPLWVCLQTLGHDGILERVKSACKLAEDMFEKIKDIQTIKYVTKEPEKKNKEDEEFSVRGLITKAINFILVFEIVSPTIVFKYVKPEEEKPGESVAAYALTDEDKVAEDRTKLYYDALNTWLVDVLQSENPNVKIDPVDIDREGVCIRFAALESARTLGTTNEDIEKFVECLKTQMSILDATVQQRETFQKIVEAQDNLTLVHIANWAGLGAVQYIPEMWVGTAAELTEACKKDINSVNCEIVHKLKANDTAFSLGETDEGLYCVRFGLVTADTDVQELLSLVYSVGKEVEDNSKYLEHMSEVIRKSIEETNKELKKETEDRLLQEGVLRQVPLVGSLLNWWSPPPKDVVKGRTFNMQSGKIESTEPIYKYHMQFQEQSSPGEKSPNPELERMKRPSGGSVTSETSANVSGLPTPTASSVSPTAPPQALIPPDVVPQSAEVTGEGTGSGTSPLPQLPAPTTSSHQNTQTSPEQTAQRLAKDVRPADDGVEMAKEVSTEEQENKEVLDLK